MKQKDIKINKTQVCLVSANSTPNLMPVLDENTKPNKVILLVSKQMKDQASYLKKTIEKQAVTVELYDIDSESSFDELQQSIIPLLKAYEAQDIALNATGGTKWMAIAIQEIFRMNDSAVFYVNIQNHNIQYLDSETPNYVLQEALKIEQFLSIYGYSIENKPVALGIAPAEKTLSKLLIANIEQWHKKIGVLNRLATDAYQKTNKWIGYENEGIDDLLEAFAQNGLVEMQKESKQFRFPGEDERRFANGEWLEKYINSILNTLKSEKVIQDNSVLNLEIVGPKGTKNEIDVAFIAKNKLHIIECKTKRMAGKASNSTGALYKIDSISNQVGINNKELIVSYRPLSNADADRAKNLKITTISFLQLSNAKNLIRDWING